MSQRRLVISLGLLLGATTVATSCGDPSPVGVDARAPGPVASKTSPQPGHDGDDGGDTDDGDERGDSLLSCRPLRYDSVTQTIGPKGGVRSESTRLNSSHMSISYAVFCLKKKKES